MCRVVTRVKMRHPIQHMPARKKKSKSTEFRLARDKDQVEEIVSNISDTELKSQEFFCLLHPHRNFAHTAVRVFAQRA
jgi:hypothetical protein